MIGGAEFEASSPDCTVPSCEVGKGRHHAAFSLAIEKAVARSILSYGEAAMGGAFGVEYLM